MPLRDWDVAAPHLVLQEAGGALSQFTGRSFDYAGGYEKHGLLVASAAALLEEIKAIVATYA